MYDILLQGQKCILHLLDVFANFEVLSVISFHFFKCSIGKIYWLKQLPEVPGSTAACTVCPQIGAFMTMIIRWCLYKQWGGGGGWLFTKYLKHCLSAVAIASGTCLCVTVHTASLVIGTFCICSYVSICTVMVASNFIYHFNARDKSRATGE